MSDYNTNANMSWQPIELDLRSDKRDELDDFELALCGFIICSGTVKE